MGSKSMKRARKNMYYKNSYCPECNALMILPEDIPQSDEKQFQPDNMCTYEHIFNKGESARKGNKRNRILCKKCNNRLGGANAAFIAEKTKNAAMDLQNIDCNCNDCLFMERDVERFKQSLSQHNQWQLNYFYAIKNNLLKKAKHWIERGFPEKAVPLTNEANRMKFQFNKKEVAIHYGDCAKFKKSVSFIPNICQIDTQECFSHRRLN